MDTPYRNRRIDSGQKRFGCLSIVVVVAVVLFLARLACSWIIDYQWWKEMGQLHTWFSMLAYSVIPNSRRHAARVRRFSGSLTPAR